MKLLQRWLENADAPQVILDLGCGKGSFDFRAYGSSDTIIVGADSDFPSLRAAGSLSGVCSDGAALPFRQDSFDLIVCHNSLEHFRDARAVMREISRILKPSGRCPMATVSRTDFIDCY